MDRSCSLIFNLLLTGNYSLSRISAALGSGFSKTTVHRLIGELLKNGFVKVQGAGRNSVYALTEYGRLFGPPNKEEYFSRDDRPEAKKTFNFSIFECLTRFNLFAAEELRKLYDREREFEIRMKALPSDARQKEMERLAIDLSWKSSQIEGNTYTLLETEALFKDSREAKGKTKAEAQMILNHKAALAYILQEPAFFGALTVKKIEDIHYLLTREMDVTRNIRSFRVGITGTSYVPLDNKFQISEALEQACTLINSKKRALEKAFLALALISYIQPFADGNKRTSRIMANALLLAGGLCPISFRTVEPMDYKCAALLFYEQNNLFELKKMFIEQFEFSCANYF